MTGIILAGGKSSRMGAQKAFLKVCGETIIDNILSVYRKIFSEIIIVTNSPRDYEYTGAKLVQDIIPGKGSLGGLYTGLMEAEFEYSFTAACDMPFVSESLVRYISCIKGHDVVVPVVGGKYEPLFALYSKNCSLIFRKQIEEGKLKIIDAYSKLRVKEIPEKELRQLDYELFSLINVNTPEEFNSALNIWEKNRR